MLLASLASNVRASLVLEDFESGSDGWTLTEATGISWNVDGDTGTNPNILTPQGSFFARSGEPNRHPGDPNGPAEEDTGKLTSPMYTVTFSTLQWLAAGHSGQQQLPPDGKNRFELLDINGATKATVNAPQWNGPPADPPAWATQSVNLLDYFQPGDAFFFRAVDERDQSTYAWLAFDNLQLTGVPVAAVPEASTVFIWSLLGLSCCLPRRSRDTSC
jgi:hypothetical protein